MDAGTDAGSGGGGGGGGTNPLIAENQRPGTTAWQLTHAAGNHEIQGYASRTSAAAGQSFDLYINVNTAHSVSWSAYRMGYYQGLGGRLVASGGPRAIAHQPACPVDSSTGMIECHWAVAFTVTPDASWITGEYLVRLVRDDGVDTYVPIVIRESTRRAPILFQASVNTWQAYNRRGGTSLYVNELGGGAFSGVHGYRVSFDRPYSSDENGAGQARWWEIPMAAWLEQTTRPPTASCSRAARSAGRGRSRGPT